MIGFKLLDGDLSITNHEIDMTEGNKLTAQTIQFVLSTNKGEWIFDDTEGVNFDNILGKKKIKPNIAGNSHLHDEVVALKDNENELAAKLRKRLNGD